MRKIMKLLLITVLFLIAACSTLENPNRAIQPVTYKNLKEKIYFTTCSGAVEDWGSCFSKAKQTCTNKYDVLSKSESATGGRRELTFQCK
jgi:hypothetical protein